MKKAFKDITPIEVEFCDVIESNDYQCLDTNEVVHHKNAPLKPLVKILQRKAKNILENKSKAVELITKALSFFKKLGNISFLKKWFLDIPTLCDMLIDSINGAYKNIPYSSLVMVVMVVIAIIYAVSPFDILNDAIPIIGILDDAAILKTVLKTIQNDLESYKAWKEIREVS